METKILPKSTQETKIRGPKRGAKQNPKENPQRTKGKEPKKSQIEQEQTTIAFLKKYTDQFLKSRQEQKMSRAKDDAYTGGGGGGGRKKIK